MRELHLLEHAQLLLAHCANSDAPFLVQLWNPGPQPTLPADAAEATAAAAAVACAATTSDVEIGRVKLDGEAEVILQLLDVRCDGTKFLAIRQHRGRVYVGLRVELSKHPVEIFVGTAALPAQHRQACRDLNDLAQKITVPTSYGALPAYP
eukprot:SAG11_NODE_5353_length_1586_cov_1.727640_2_plen_151_part_00